MSSDTSPADLFSNIFTIVQPKGKSLFAFNTTQSTRTHFPAHTPALHLVHDAPALTAHVQGVDEPITLTSGDLLLLPFGHACELSEAEPSVELDASGMCQQPLPVIERVGANARIKWLTGIFEVDQALFSRLWHSLPNAIVIKPAEGDRTFWLPLCHQLLLVEAIDTQLGSTVMVSRLLESIFINALRTWALGSSSKPNCFTGSTDSKIGRALYSIHLHPERPWSVNDLAELANMSRSAFAARFLKLVGQTPAAYIWSYRLNRSAQLLRLSNLSISEIALSEGYQSEAAFSRSFKQHFGLPPRDWRQT